MPNHSIVHSDIKDFVYITFKLQAMMYSSDEKFYGVHNTVDRISSYVFAYTNGGSKELLLSAKEGMIAGFNRLKYEENIPILCYNTIEKLISSIDHKL